MGRTGRPNLIHYAIAACSAGHRLPRAQLGPWAVRWPRRSCTALYEAAPPAVGSIRGRDHGPCTGSGSYASTHAHLGTAGRETHLGSASRIQNQLCSNSLRL
jgi:hypothetical protein